MFTDQTHYSGDEAPQIGNTIQIQYDPHQIQAAFFFFAENAKIMRKHMGLRIDKTIF